ncbi:hypothetical protein P4571_18235, partial [Niallia alba]|uniref:hypothetical protein n=1 Tax=Niallia alba TaxID=2729105 RepID=UPI002E1E519C|nr:hypothetical protein [Niallia alba]
LSVPEKEEKQRKREQRVALYARKEEKRRLSPYNCVKRKSHFILSCLQCLTTTKNIEKRGIK